MPVKFPTKMKIILPWSKLIFDREVSSSLSSFIIHHYYHHHHHLPPWIRSFDLLRHRRIAIVSWGVHGLFFLEVWGRVSGVWCCPFFQGGWSSFVCIWVSRLVFHKSLVLSLWLRFLETGRIKMLTTSYSIDIIHVHTHIYIYIYVVQFAYLHPNTHVFSWVFI